MINYNPEDTFKAALVSEPVFDGPQIVHLSETKLQPQADDQRPHSWIIDDKPRPGSSRLKRKLPFDDSPLRSNLRSINEHIDDTYYTIRVSPSMMKTTSPVIGFTERYEYATFTAASSSDRLNINWPIPALWVSGKLEATYFYSGSVGSIAAIRWNWIACSQPLGGDINATVDLNDSIDAPGPATANTIASVTFTSYLTIGPADVLLGLRVLREGAHANDMYAGDAYWLGATFRFIPALQTVDTKGRLKR